MNDYAGRRLAALQARPGDRRALSVTRLWDSVKRGEPPWEPGYLNVDGRTRPFSFVRLADTDWLAVGLMLDCALVVEADGFASPVSELVTVADVQPYLQSSR